MDKWKDRKRNSTWLSLVIIIFLFIFQQFASKTGSLITDTFNYTLIDEYGIFAPISVHHIIQMLLALIVIFIFSKKYKVDFGFSVGDKSTGIKYVTIFAIAFSIYALLLYSVSYFNNQLVLYDYPLEIKNVLGTLGFQLFLSGPSEEILFRALPITIISLMINKKKEIKIGKWNLTMEVIVAAILFSIAHVKWTINPYSISMDYFQLIYAFILGLIFGKVYVESGSVIYPMAMHSISNVVMVGLGYIFILMSY